VLSVMTGSSLQLFLLCIVSAVQRFEILYEFEILVLYSCILRMILKCHLWRARIFDQEGRVDHFEVC
jgi:hypothetical protein